MEKSDPLPLLASKEWTPSSLNARHVVPTNKYETKRWSSAPNTPDRSTSSVLARHKKAMTALITEAQIQSLQWTIRHSPLPSSPSKRKRTNHIEPGHFTLLPSLASVASASHRRKRNSAKTFTSPAHNITFPPRENDDPPTNSGHSASTITRSDPPSSSSSPPPKTNAAHATALQIVSRAARRQTAARDAYASTAALSESLKSLSIDSALAASLARKSREEARRAAERAERSAKKIREANELAARDVERACLEVEEADAQALEAKDFLRRVEGLMGGGVSLRGGPEKFREDDGSERLDAVLEVIVGNGSDCSSVEDSGTSVDCDQKKDEYYVLQQVGKRQREFNNLPFPQQQMRRTWEEPTRVQMELLTKPLRKFQGHSSPITQIAAIDSKRFISSSWDKTIRLWDAEKGTCIRSYRGHGDWVHTVAVLDNGFFLSGSDDRTIKLWSVNEGECIRTYCGHESFVKALCVVSCEKHFLSGSRDKTIKLWNIQSGKCIQTYRGHRDAVSAVLSLSSNRFASGSFDRSIKIWDLRLGECVRTLVRHSGPVKSLAVVQDSTRSASQILVSAADDKTMLLWDTASGQCLHKFNCKNSLVFSVSFICDGFFLSCGGNTLQLWHIPSGNCVKTYETPSLSLAVARLDDVKFVTGSDKILYLWNLFLS